SHSRDARRKLPRRRPICGKSTPRGLGHRRRTGVTHGVFERSGLRSATMNSEHSESAWAAPTAFAPVDADVCLPGSKSLTNRALILAALADNSSIIRGPLRARDTELMASALRALGTTIEFGDGDWRVSPATLVGDASIDCGLAGTVMRFVPPVAALTAGDVSFDGDPRARERPMGELVRGLRDLGAVIDDDGRATLPFTVRGKGGLRGGRVTIDASASSQYVSGLLLAAPRFDNGLTLHHAGKQVPSLPHIEMTVAMLRQ